MITGNTSVVINTKTKSDSTNVISSLWTMVMNKVTHVMEYVMGEMTASDECDVCDGKNKKSPKAENNPKIKTGCNMPDEREMEKIESAIAIILKSPSEKQAVIEPSKETSS